MNLLNKKNITVLVIALLVAGAGTYLYQQSCEQKEQSAKSALYQIQKTFESESTALSATEKTPGAKLDVETKFSKTVAALNQMISDQKISDHVLLEASLKLGTLYSEYSKDDSLDKAIANFKKGTEFAKTSFQKSSAFYLLGATQERANQLKEAADSFQKALNQNEEGMKEEILLSLVRVNMKANNAVQAKAFADKLNKEAPGTRAAQEAQKLISKT